MRIVVFVDPHWLQMHIVVSVVPHWFSHTHRNLDNFIHSYIMNSLPLEEILSWGGSKSTVCPVYLVQSVQSCSARADFFDSFYCLVFMVRDHPDLPWVLQCTVSREGWGYTSQRKSQPPERLWTIEWGTRWYSIKCCLLLLLRPFSILFSLFLLFFNQQ